MTLVGDWDENGLVKDLIDENTKEWNLNLLQEMFDSEEVANIKSISVSNLGLQDVLVWHYDNRGVYTVKSGYKLLCKLEEDSENMNRGINTECWAKIWNIKMLKKI